MPQYAKDELTQAIEAFFSSLPATQKPPLEKVRILHWGDLATLLNEQGPLADSWLGTGPAGIVGYETYATGLAGFKRYLKEENLEFIPPADDDPAHPQNLLTAAVAKAGAGGILLFGAGGVGKTRTCFEAARLAHQQKWRVLHITPGEPPVTETDLLEVILQGSAPTLLVIDYLDQMAGLDYAALRHRLLPTAQAAGIPLAMLANARPGLLRQANRERDALFQRVELKLGSRRERITAHFQATIAPLASARLGPAEVRRVCGPRPIISMFIALELERYAREGRLAADFPRRLRQGELRGWIQKRLEEDGLASQPTHPFLPPSPGPVMTGAAAALAAAPIPLAQMHRVLAATLTAAGLGEVEAMAEQIIASLKRSGWLEESGYLLATPHDVVADELLEGTLLDRDLSLIRRDIIDRVFCGARAMPRVLGRFSVSLDRVLGQEDLPDPLPNQLRQEVSTWLAGHAAEMGRTFTAADADEVSYALGAVVTGSAWSAAALEAWEDLIAPWLEVHAQSAATRHLLYRGLSALPTGAARELAATALRWLLGHGLVLEATYVLGPLLARQDLAENQAQEAIKDALAWLKLEPHRLTLEAGYVLPPLLARQDLDDQQAQSAIKYALAWLEPHRLALEAAYVLPPLLNRKDLAENQAQDAVAASLAWLNLHFHTRDAEFVLKRLLGKSLLADDRKQECLRLALKRLETVFHTEEASFLLVHCLKDRALAGEEWLRTLGFARQWLQANPDSPHLDYVCKRLLRNPGIDDDLWREAANFAFTWLRRTPMGPQRDHTLNSLVNRCHLLTTEEKTFLQEEAQAWLAAYPSSKDAGWLSRSLQRLQDASPQTREDGERIQGPSLSDSLSQSVQKGEIPDPGLFRKGLEAARQLLAQDRPGPAGYYLSYLLILAARSGNAALIGAVKQAVGQLLSHPGLIANQRQGFTRALYRSLDAGAWPDQESAKLLLESLGLHHPEPPS